MNSKLMNQMSNVTEANAVTVESEYSQDITCNGGNVSILPLYLDVSQIMAGNSKKQFLQNGALHKTIN